LQQDYSEEVSIDNANPNKALLDKKSKKSKDKKTNVSSGKVEKLDINHWTSDEVIMSKADFETVKQEYLKAENEQKKCSYKTRKCLSESFFGKFLCCCMKVKDNLNIPWDEMTTM